MSEPTSNYTTWIKVLEMAREVEEAYTPDLREAAKARLNKKLANISPEDYRLAEEWLADLRQSVSLRGRS